MLLFDEIVVDRGAAGKAIEYARTGGRKDYEGKVIDTIRPTEAEVQIFHHLIESRLFRKERVVEMITDEDFERIEQGYNMDVGAAEPSPEEFRSAVAVLENKYGPDYACPNPVRFEEMNINVTWILLEKFSAVPLDDIMRNPLYEYKAIQTASPYISDRRIMTKTAYDVIEQARQVLYLPTEPLYDIDAFLALHKDLRVRKFREKVHNLSRRRTPLREISREIFDANLELQKLEISSYSIVIGFLGLLAGLTLLLQGKFATGSISTATGSLSLAKELLKPRKMDKYGWLEIVKGLCEI